MPILFVPAPVPAPAFYMTPRSEAHISDLIIHHTAGSIEQTVIDIDREHRAIGDAMIGYNFVIDPKDLQQPDGKVKIFVCRPTNVLPAATEGRNPESVNISVIGQYDSLSPNFTGEPQAEVITALKELALWAHFRWSLSRTIGHRDVAPMFYPNDQSEYSTACPGNKLYAHIPGIKIFVYQNYHLARMAR